jgi:hypothetical protein
MSRRFGRERSVITKHLRNVFADGELREESNVQKFARCQVGQAGAVL